MFPATYRVDKIYITDMDFTQKKNPGPKAGAQLWHISCREKFNRFTLLFYALGMLSNIFFVLAASDCEHRNRDNDDSEISAVSVSVFDDVVKTNH